MPDVAAEAANPPVPSKSLRHLVREVVHDYQLYLLLLLPVAFVFVFNYLPMYGAQIAFRDHRAIDGIWGSQWVGLKHFSRFFSSPDFGRILRNSLLISLYSLAAGFPFPILLALSLNATLNRKFKKSVQTITYAPYFISMTVMVGMVVQFLSLRHGIVNHMLDFLGFARISFMGRPELFRSIYVWSGVWQTTGFGSIIYLAALSAVDEELHSAAIVDGATRFQRIGYIDLPGILPTATIILILSAGNLINVGFEKAFLMQNPMNLAVSEVIQTYVYKIGVASQLPNYSYATAIGLFNSVVSLALIIMVNAFARKIGETSLW